MIVGMALVAMRGTVTVAMIVMAMAVMVVVMAAAATLAMGMLVIMIVLVAMRVIMAMVLMVMSVAMIVTMMMVMVMMVVPAAAIVAMGMVMNLGLRLERALHLRHGATLPADQLGQGRIGGDIERVGRHLGRDMVATEVPSEAHQPQRVLGADFQELLRRGLDLHEAAVLQLQRVAVVERGRLVERDREFQATLRRHRHPVEAAVAMAEAQRIDDAVGADGGLAKDGSGAKHMRRSHAGARHNMRPSPDRSLVAQTGGRATKRRCHRWSQRGSALTSVSNFLSRRERSAGEPQRGVS